MLRVGLVEGHAEDERHREIDEARSARMLFQPAPCM
jgi:hypothetical protein